MKNKLEFKFPEEMDKHDLKNFYNSFSEEALIKLKQEGEIEISGFESKLIMHKLGKKIRNLMDYIMTSNKGNNEKGYLTDSGKRIMLQFGEDYREVLDDKKLKIYLTKQ